VEELPSESSDDLANGSDDEWQLEKEKDRL